ncbi:MAG: hypothetical protein AAFP90_12845 [Planctomycetota bacterium]
MAFFDLAGVSIWMRLALAAAAFVLLAGAAAGIIVASMMLVLFAVDGSHAGSVDDTLFYRTAYVVLGSLLIAVVVPPILMTCRISVVFSMIPAGLGFTIAGFLTLWFVIVHVGGNG